MENKILQHEYNLIQNFYIIGISKVNDTLVSKILSRFPQVNLPYINIDDEIIVNHTFPNGLQIKEEVFEEERFFFELVNKYNYSEIKKKKNENNIYNPPHPKIYYTCYLFDDIIEHEVKSQKGEKKTVIYHTQKALVFSSFYQFFPDFFFILNCLLMWVKKIVNFDLEKCIYNFIFKIPAPCPGLRKVCYETVLGTMGFQLNPINKIPSTGADIKSILRIKVNKIFDILKLVLLEVPVIFFSQEKLNLANTVKSFEEILLPFSYPFPVIEILPKVYYKTLEKMSCFLVGINAKYKDDFFEVNDINLKDKDYVVVNLSEEDPSVFYEKKKTEKYGILLKEFDKKIEKNAEKETKYSKEKVSFPKHYLGKAMKRITKLIIGKNGAKTNLDDSDIDKVRYEFYYFFISTFQNYKSFLILNKDTLIKLYKDVEKRTIEIDKIFRYQEFISKDMESIEFYDFFVKTKILKTFLLKVLYPSTIEEQMEILFLDENIRIKKNKYIFNQLFQEDTPFLKTDMFDIKEQNNEIIKEEELIVDSILEPIEKNFPLLNEKKMDELYTKNFLEKDIIINNLYIEFYIKCYQILKNKKFIEGYSSTGYNINLVNDVKSNNENYILKLWVLLICYSFKYLDKYEKWIIFYEFLNELQINTNSKNTILDPYLCDLIFSTFISEGDKQMCSLLYKELNESIYLKNDYLTFIKLHQKFLNNDNNFEKSFTKTAHLKPRNYNIFNLPKGKKYEIVLYDPHPRCAKFSLKPVILNFTSQNEDELTYICNICKEERKAKITVSLGNEKEDKMYQLYSAKYLYYFIKDLGDYNMNLFYKKYTGIFFNLIILFQLRGNFYDFLFPYKDIKTQAGFSDNNLKEKHVKKVQIIDEVKDKPKWYEAIEEDKGKGNILNKMKNYKISNVNNFQNNEINLNSESFFKKFNKNTIRKTFGGIRSKKLKI